MYRPQECTLEDGAQSKVQNEAFRLGHMRCAALAADDPSLALRKMNRPLLSKLARPVARALGGQVNSVELSPLRRLSSLRATHLLRLPPGP